MNVLTADQSFALMALLIIVMGVAYVIHTLVMSHRERQLWKREDAKIERGLRHQLDMLDRQQARAERADALEAHRLEEIERGKPAD